MQTELHLNCVKSSSAAFSLALFPCNETGLYQANHGPTNGLVSFFEFNSELVRSWIGSFDVISPRATQRCHLQKWKCCGYQELQRIVLVELAAMFDNNNGNNAFLPCFDPVGFVSDCMNKSRICPTHSISGLVMVPWCITKLMHPVLDGS